MKISDEMVGAAISAARTKQRDVSECAARAALEAVAPMILEEAAKAGQWQMGYRAATKDAVAFVHDCAGRMNDRSAIAALNVCADELGRQGKAAIRAMGERG
jgi:hypothetical protein